MLEKEASWQALLRESDPQKRKEKAERYLSGRLENRKNLIFF